MYYSDEFVRAFPVDLPQLTCQVLPPENLFTSTGSLSDAFQKDSEGRLQIPQFFGFTLTELSPLNSLLNLIF